MLGAELGADVPEEPVVEVAVCEGPGVTPTDPHAAMLSAMATPNTHRRTQRTVSATEKAIALPP